MLLYNPKTIKKEKNKFKNTMWGWVEMSCPTALDALVSGFKS